jgi:hypothetical protein
MFISAKDTPPRSHEEAIRRGLLYGQAAVEHTVPPDMFEAGLEEGVKAWRQVGCPSAWIDGGIEAARAAYWQRFRATPSWRTRQTLSTGETGPRNFAPSPTPFSTMK